jgi:hypothetical protein
MGANVPAVTAKRGRHSLDGALTPTRNKPSFTPDAAEGGTRLTRVRPILVPVSPWGSPFSKEDPLQGLILYKSWERVTGTSPKEL